MKISNCGASRLSPYSTRRERRTESGAGWEKYLDPEVQKRKMLVLPEGEGLPSVWMQFREDYSEWKAQQPELALPDGQGWTEENLVFLREHYAGELSAFEVYDALETMKHMGAISQKDKRAAAGSQMIAIDAKRLGGFVTYGADPNSEAAWLGGFDEAPMVGFDTLEDILSWVKAYRAEDHPDVVTYAEAQARGWI